MQGDYRQLEIVRIEASAIRAHQEHGLLAKVETRIGGDELQDFVMRPRLAAEAPRISAARSV